MQVPDIEQAERKQRWERPQGSLEPSPAQTQLWGTMYGGEPDPHGWFLGWCPIHDRDGNLLDQPTAQYNFAAGVMRCLKDPPCHAKRSVSLTNLLALMAQGGSE
jgi:hypothetical protein